MEYCMIFKASLASRIHVYIITMNVQGSTGLFWLQKVPLLHTI